MAKLGQVPTRDYLAGNPNQRPERTSKRRLGKWRGPRSRSASELRRLGLREGFEPAILAIISGNEPQSARPWQPSSTKVDARATRVEWTPTTVWPTRTFRFGSGSDAYERMESNTTSARVLNSFLPACTRTNNTDRSDACHSGACPRACTGCVRQSTEEADHSRP